MVGWRDVPPEELPELYEGEPEGTLVVEHPKIPFISYCYEWSFEMMRAAALLHLELVRECLEYGYILKDATPYNIQFIGSRPVFIDVPSFVPWQEGNVWQAYAQFCRQLLNPLLLTGLTGVQFQPWMRGSMGGIDPEDLRRLLGFRKKLRRGVFLDVVLQAWINRRLKRGSSKTEGVVGTASIGKKQMLGLVSRLEGTIRKLKAPGRPSQWVDYESQNSYNDEAQEFKEQMVDRAVAAAAPKIVYDLGCNTGLYSLIAARHAEYVVAMDNDPEVIESLYHRVQDSQLNVLPLVMNILDPSPDQGWNQAERGGVIGRRQVDFVLCLALVHHLSIGGNIPLKQFTDWLARFTSGGVIEFVPMADPMVQGMVRGRENAYTWYNQQEFEDGLQEHFKIAERSEVPGTKRLLYVFSK
jgi:SAM-dependent methyltransferase